MNKVYDVLIIGGGVAGMSAAVYTKRSGKSVAMIEKNTLGGTTATLNKIKNFPSQTEIDGFSLAQMFINQMKNLEVEIIADEVVSSDFSADLKTLRGKKGTYSANKIIIATGLSYVELGKNENEFLGRGVSYCAVCDANFFKGREVCVLSRKGSGLKEAKYLSNIVSKVTVLDEEDMSTFSQANQIPNLEVVSNAKAEKLLGKGTVEGVECIIDGKKEAIKTNGVFIALGRKPKTDVFKGLELDNLGFIKTNEYMETSIKGVFAVGDVRAGVLKQIVTACNDGAIAGRF